MSDYQSPTGVVSMGSVINDRYEIRSLIGVGTFATVYRAYDKIQKKEIALKGLIRMSIENFHSYKNESEALAKIASNWKANTTINCIGETPVESFLDKTHRWICLDLCGPNLRDYLKDSNEMGYPIRTVRRLLREILNGVAFLHGIGITHTDIKPENIVFSNYHYSPTEGWGKLKIIDFGSAVTHVHPSHYPITAEYYRAVEVWLNLPWNAKVDIWSVGCIALELFTGTILFQTCHDHSYVRFAQRLLQKPLPLPMKNLIDPSFFNKNGSIKYCIYCPETAEMAQLSDLLLSDDMLHIYFHKLCASLLRLRPLERISARKALKHKFFGLNG